MNLNSNVDETRQHFSQRRENSGDLEESDCSSNKGSIKDDINNQNFLLCSQILSSHLPNSIKMSKNQLSSSDRPPATNKQQTWKSIEDQYHTNVIDSLRRKIQEIERKINSDKGDDLFRYNLEPDTPFETVSKNKEKLVEYYSKKYLYFLIQREQLQANFQRESASKSFFSTINFDNPSEDRQNDKKKWNVIYKIFQTKNIARIMIDPAFTEHRKKYAEYQVERYLQDLKKYKFQGQNSQEQMERILKGLKADLNDMVHFFVCNKDLPANLRDSFKLFYHFKQKVRMEMMESIYNHKYSSDPENYLDLSDINKIINSIFKSKSTHLEQKDFDYLNKIQVDRVNESLSSLQSPSFTSWKSFSKYISYTPCIEYLSTQFLQPDLQKERFWRGWNFFQNPNQHSEMIEKEEPKNPFWRLNNEIKILNDLKDAVKITENNLQLPSLLDALEKEVQNRCIYEAASYYFRILDCLESVATGEERGFVETNISLTKSICEFIHQDSQHQIHCEFTAKYLYKTIGVQSITQSVMGEAQSKISELFKLMLESLNFEQFQKFSSLSRQEGDSMVSTIVKNKEFKNMAKTWVNGSKIEKQGLIGRGNSCWNLENISKFVNLSRETSFGYSYNDYLQNLESQLMRKADLAKNIYQRRGILVINNKKLDQNYLRQQFLKSYFNQQPSSNQQGALEKENAALLPASCLDANFIVKLALYQSHLKKLIMDPVYIQMSLLQKILEKGNLNLQTKAQGYELEFEK